MPRVEQNTHVEFYTEAVKDETASRTAGRVVFKEVEFAKISTIGDKDNNFVVRAHEPYMPDKENGGMLCAAQRYREAYEAFKAGLDEAASGTPLNHLPFLDKAQIAELKAANIKTAEALAHMGDAAIGKGFGWRELRERARVWLDDSDKDAVAAKARLEADQAKTERDDMAKRLAEMEAKLAALDEPKRGPGRPRKDAD